MHAKLLIQDNGKQSRAYFSTTIGERTKGKRTSYSQTVDKQSKASLVYTAKVSTATKMGKQEKVVGKE